MPRKKPETETVRVETGSVSEETPAAPTRSKALVFISHDTRDADVAEAFANLLQDASGGILRSFRSSDRRGTSGIEFGAEWYSAIMGRLQDATDVVALLTEQSIGRPWILYEAGVAKGRLDAVVFGVALGVPLDQVGVGPFAQFQNSADDEDSLTKLVLQLIRRNPDADPREEAVKRQVVAFRAVVTDILRKRSSSAPPASVEIDASAVAKLFEEVKVMFRHLPDQLERSVERRFADHQSERLGIAVRPGVVSELYEMLIGSHPGDSGTVWLRLARMIRPVAPAMYRPLLEMHRSWQNNDVALIQSARDNILNRLDRLSWQEHLEALPSKSARHLSDLHEMLIFYLRHKLELQTRLGPFDDPLLEAFAALGKPISNEKSSPNSDKEIPGNKSESK